MSVLHQHELRQEIRRLATAIANVFTVDGDLPEAEVESIHNQFVAVIDAVNSRLRNCDDLLRRGLRQEAIQDCEADPNLLDLVTELDLPEWSAWADYVRQFGIPPQPELLLNVAAELNDAYTQAEPLEAVLRLHRLHALARSPLADRLSVLRKVAERDPSNAVWKDDIKSYERNRILELENELRKLSSTNDLRGLSQLRREVTESSWLLKPPQAFLERVVQSHQRLLIADARQRLEQLEPTINAAFSEFNEARAARARTEWEKYQEIAGLQAEDDLSLRVRPAFEWLDEVQRGHQHELEFEQATLALQHGLDDEGTTRSELLRLHSAAERFEEPLPERLQRRFLERIRSLEIADQRRGRLRLLSAFAAIGVIAILAIFAIQWRVRNSNIQAASDGMEKLLDAGQLGEAASYYERTAKDLPYAAQSSRMQQLLSRLTSETNEDQSRKKRFAESLELARKLADEGASMNSYAQALEELHKSGSIAKSEGELAELKSIELDARQRRNRLQKEIDDRFQSAVTKIVPRAKQLPKLTDTELNELRRDAEHLGKSPDVSDSVLRGGNLTLLVSSISEELKRRKDDYGKDQALAALYQAIGKPAVYERELRNYLTFEPTGGRSHDFQSVLDHDIPFLKVVTRWNVLSDQWAALPLSPDTEYGKTAKAIIAQVKKEFGSYPTAQPVVALSDYVDSICNRADSSGKTILGSLKDVFSSDIFSMNYLINDGTPVYFLNKPEDSPSSLIVGSLLDVRDLSKSKRRSYTKTKLASIENGQLWGTSPHGQIARKVLPLLTNEQRTFEFRVCGVLSYLFDSKDVDPVLKCGLMQVVIAAAKPGSTILAQDLQAFEDTIKTNTDLSDVNWLAADENVAKTARNLTQGKLDRVTQAPRDIYTKLVEPRVRKSFNERPKLAKLSWIGALSKNSDGTWKCTCSPESDPIPKGELVICDFADPTATRFIVAGQQSDGKTVLDMSQAAHFSDGRIVFLRQ